jgi:hypothetical protein
LLFSPSMSLTLHIRTTQMMANFANKEKMSKLYMNCNLC